MASPAERFFTGLFDEKDYANLTRNCTVSMIVCGVGWGGTVFIPTKTGELSTLKSTSFTIAVLAGFASIFFAIKREKPRMKRTVLDAVEDNDFIDKTGVITGLNAELTAKHLEDCLKKKIPEKGEIK